ncbi:MAG: hypothetical protein JNM56_02960 [Planctomycetia bacterium]|nr:hypothetical protein [Planctomycetia bacterium]
MMNTDRWEDARRIEAWAGEVRVNLVRLAALVAFYGHHLLNVYVLHPDDASIRGAFHTAVTGLIVAWTGSVLALHYCLSRRWVPPALKFVAVAWDILMITALLVILAHQAHEPKSWLAVLYLLVVATAPLRLSLPLVWMATLGSMAAYLGYLGYLKYGLEVPDEARLSRPNQVIFELALGAAGIIAGQMVRQARRLTQGYPVTVAESNL